MHVDACDYVYFLQTWLNRLSFNDSSGSASKAVDIVHSEPGTLTAIEGSSNMPDQMT